MNHSRIVIIGRSPLKVKLKVERAPIFILSSLWAVLVITLILPLAAISYTLVWGNGPHITILFMLGLAFIIGRFLLRTILWNTYGSELLIFGKEQFTYQADYKYFKGPIHSLKSVYKPYYYFADEERKQACIAVKNEVDEVLTVTKLPIDEIDKLWEEVFSQVSIPNEKDILDKES